MKKRCSIYTRILVTKQLNPAEKGLFARPSFCKRAVIADPKERDFQYSFIFSFQFFMHEQFFPYCSQRNDKAGLP